MPRNRKPAPMFGDASDLPLFSGTPIEPGAPRDVRRQSPARPTPAPELPGMPTAPAYVTINGYQVRADLAPKVRADGRLPHVVHHTGAWQPGADDAAGPGRPDATFGGLVTLIAVTTTRARAIERTAGVWLVRPATTHEQ